MSAPEKNGLTAVELAGLAACVKPEAARLKDCQPCIRIIGGKFYLAKKIIPLMPAHKLYCEPFCGAAHVFMRKREAEVEVLNDINGELVNFFRVAADEEGLAYLLGKFRWALYSWKIFNEYREMFADEGKGLDSYERAWRFLYLNICGFGGRGLYKGGRPNFGVGNDRITVFWNMPPRLEKFHKRIRHAFIENLPYGRCVSRYDKPGTLFYMDPPYYGYEDYYGKGNFTREDFELLADILANIKGKFVLSINDCAETREIFGRFNLLAEPDVNYSANKNHRCRKRELVYGNFEI